jgi:hypothetical protein
MLHPPSRTGTAMALTPDLAAAGAGAPLLGYIETT